ncbi:hypothetical protein C1H46_042742 [Malus baccata]|uniref:Leucine-rich repeat-containing N-terminal plant-type domain-containing protein n=1 Tax=Malus baccata TaxID=106549 RepID=A0A540KCP4_MALBA|nr:hypothetical protein C1H46_042742 [Malus baccata]
MRQLAGNLFLLVCFIIIALSCFTLRGLAQLPKLPQQEVDALQEIATTMGAKYWTFNADACRIETVGLTKKQTKGSQANTDCDCNFENSTVCHVATLTLKGFSLPGLLPPQLVKLPYLRKIDFAITGCNKQIPQEWASTKLTYISVLVNRLSGQIPKYLGHITTLTFLNLEGNQFSGIVPTELGNLVNLQTLMLSSNQLTGYLPETFSGLRILNDFRINDNNFIGTLPDWVQNWKKLTRLEMHSSGLEGPIPSNISVLNNLEELVLRNCNISGEIPAYIWSMKNLEMLDVSFNKLAGQLPSTIGAERLKFVFLTGNLLSGNVPRSILRDGSVV